VSAAAARAGSAAPRPRQSPAELPRSERRARRGSGKGRALLRALVLAAAVLSAFATVVWRQTRASERQREIRALDADVAVAEGEKTELMNRIQALQSRARITRVARERLGLHLPSDSEIVLLPLPADAAGDASSAVPAEAR
jgi:cell division protein FtsL